MSEHDHKHDSGSPEWVTCKHSLALLVEYLDGTLPPQEKAALDRHFRACPPCIDFVRKYRSTPDLCRSTMKEDVPAEMSQRLTAFLHGKLKAG